MRLMAALFGDLERMLADEVRIAEHAVTQSIREATDGLKTELRNQITGAGLGQRLANTWRGEVYPKGKQSIKAAGLVYSRAPEVVGAHDRGATIRSKDGFWLAIPLPAAGRGPRGKRMTPRPLGKTPRPAPALRLPPRQALAPGRRKPACPPGPARRLLRCLAESPSHRSGPGHRADVPAGAASDAQEEIRHR